MTPSPHLNTPTAAKYLSGLPKIYCILSGPELEGGALRGAAGLVRAVCAVRRAVTHGEVGHAALVRGAAELGPGSRHKLQSLNRVKCVKARPAEVLANIVDSHLSRVTCEVSRVTWSRMGRGPDTAPRAAQSPSPPSRSSPAPGRSCWSSSGRCSHKQG